MRALRSTITSFPTPGMVKPLRASLYASAASSSRNCPTCFLVRPVFSDNRFRVSDFEIPATCPSCAAYGLFGSRRILHERTRAHDATVTLRVVDDPPDRPEWLRETIRLLVHGTTAERDRLLGRVARASDADLAKGSDDDWGLGQVAAHLLIVERGVALIGLRLAQGAPPAARALPSTSRGARPGPAKRPLGEAALGHGNQVVDGARDLRPGRPDLFAAQGVRGTGERQGPGDLRTRREGPRGFLGRAGQDSRLAQTIFQGARVGSAVRQVVPGRRAQHLGELPRPPREGGPGCEDRLLLGGGARRLPGDHVSRPPRHD